MPFFTVETHRSVDAESAKVRILNTQNDDDQSTGVYTADTVKKTPGAIPPTRNIELAKLDLGKIPTGVLLAIVSHHLVNKKNASSLERIAGMQVSDVMEDYADGAQRADSAAAAVVAAQQQEELSSQNP